MAIAMHAEPVPGAPGVLRWIVPELDLPLGRWEPPGELGVLVASGALKDVIVEPRAVRLSAAEPDAWSELAPSVRTALSAALQDPATWQVDGDRALVLATIAGDVLAGPVGDYIRSHGGVIAVESVDGDEVVVSLGQTCGRCEIAGRTLDARIEPAIRRRYPDLVGVRAAQAPKKPWLRRIGDR